MKLKNSYLLIISFLLLAAVKGIAAPLSYYQLKVYHYKTKEQQAIISNYLQNAYIPAMHRAGFKSIGVFSTTEQDTVNRRIFVFIPANKIDKLVGADEKLAADKEYLTSAKAYTDALYNNAPYSRLEIIVLKAFAGMPQPAVPSLTAPKSERVYELRSYESPTEKYHLNKVDMFNTGNEIGLFNKLGFNAVFYGAVLAGDRMPNLMYLTVYANKDERDKHWVSFRDAPEWKVLSGKDEYKNNVSNIDDLFLQAASYSDY